MRKRTADYLDVPAPLVVLALHAGLCRQERRSGLSFKEWLTILRPCSRREQLIVIYRLLHGYSDRAIGDVLDLSYGRVSQLWFQALVKLSKTKTVLDILDASTK